MTEFVFSTIVDETNTFFLSDEVRLIENKKSLPVRLVENSLFPSLEEDLGWFASVWDDLKDGFQVWVESQTVDGSFVAEYLENQQKEFTKDYSGYVRKLREKVYRSCFKQEGEASPVLSYYLERGLRPVFLTLVVDSPSTIVRSCVDYYEKLGYKFRDGVAVNPSSIYYLARRGKLPLTTKTFNLGVLPWVLDESVSLQAGRKFERNDYLEEYGWSREALASALDGETLSLPELVLKYRVTKGTDGYIDWDSVKKYKYFSKENLKTIIFEVFGRQPDVLEGLSYRELVDQLKLMSDKSLDITQEAKLRIEKKGFSKILNKKSESLGKSLWYPDLSGEIQLLLYGVPVPRDLIPVTYKSYLWARENKTEVSYGYVVMIAQRLGFWKVISKLPLVTTETILDEIQTNLESLS
jgi:hypothetical protein